MSLLVCLPIIGLGEGLTEPSNPKFGKPLKIGGSQKIYIFRGVDPIRESSENFHFQGIILLRGDN